MAAQTITSCPGCGLPIRTDGALPYPASGPQSNVEPFWCRACGGQCPLDGTSPVVLVPATRALTDLVNSAVDALSSLDLSAKANQKGAAAILASLLSPAGVSADIAVAAIAAGCRIEVWS